MRFDFARGLSRRGRGVCLRACHQGAGPGDGLLGFVFDALQQGFAGGDIVDETDDLAGGPDL